MADPVLTRIVNTIKGRIADLFDDIDQVVVARDGRPIDVKTTTVVVQQLPAQPAPTLNRMGNPPSIGYAVPVHVHQFMQIAPAGETEEEYSARCNEAASDLIALITTPLSGPAIHWHTMDGAAINCSIGPMRYLPSDAGIRPGITIPLTIMFRVSENDHTEARN